MRPHVLLIPLATLIVPVSAWAQERGWDERWVVHPIWWPFVALAVALAILVVLGWVLLNLAPLVLAILGAVLGIRWLMRNASSSRPDAAVSILRERYARGEITKEEFDARLRDLGGAR